MNKQGANLMKEAPESSAEPSSLYKQTENTQELLDQLRDQYISYKEYASRSHLELKSNGKYPLTPTPQSISISFQ